jgi:hypothetical protein
MRRLGVGGDKGMVGFKGLNGMSQIHWLGKSTDSNHHF